MDFGRVKRARLGSRATAVAMVVAISACGKRQGAGHGMPPAQVGVVTVEPRTVPVTYEFDGLVEPFRRVDVRARVDGIIERRAFTEGSTVHRGQLLYRIDPVRYQAAYEGALATFVNDTSTLNRMLALLPRHAVAQQDVDNAQAAADAARAALVQARKDLSDTEVRAEISGRVGRTRLEVGARVTGPGDVLTTIDQLNPIYVSFHPSSDQVSVWHTTAANRELLQPGSKLAVRVTLPSGDTLPVVGRLDYVAPALDSTTGTLEIRATFDNATGALVPGEFVHVRLDGFTKANALTVPQRAVQQGLGRQFVYVVEAGDTVSARDVHPGLWADSDWIIDSGLSPGDRVIVDGVQKVFPGGVVRPTPEGAASAAGGAGRSGRGAGASEAGASGGAPRTPRQGGARGAARADAGRRSPARSGRSGGNQP